MSAKSKTEECENRLILRDKLAIERTYLARERTVLSYVRTGLAIVGVALFFYKFIDMDLVIKTILTIVILVPGAFVTFYGLYLSLIHI